MDCFQSGDGSLNAFNTRFGECYASNSYGALSEKLAKHIVPVWETLSSRMGNAWMDRKATDSSKKQVWILDLCFGLGYNALLSRLFSGFDSVEFCIISIECDKDNLALASRIHSLEPHLVSQLDSGEEVSLSHNVRLKILWGDALLLLPILCEKQGGFSGFDVVYQDPFSYEKTPQLWDYRHFCRLASLMKDSGIITTYATRKAVIVNAQKAGLLAYRYAVDATTMDLLYRTCSGLYPRIISMQVHKRKSSIFSKLPIGIAGSVLYGAL